MLSNRPPQSQAQRIAAASMGLVFAILTSLTSNAATAGEGGGLAAGKGAYVRHDYALALRLLLPEAERGSPLAQTYVGHMYENGLGVPRDYEVAAGWLNAAAQQGEPTAQYLLGLLFDKGFGVPMDWVQAEVWLNLASAHAPTERERRYWAQLRDGIAQKLTLDQLAEAQRRAYAWEPVSPQGLIVRY